MRITLKPLAMLALATLPFMAAPAYSAEMFSGTEFLKWERAGQESYIRTNIGMAVLIADLNNDEQVACINRWYGDNETSANSFIVDAIRKYPDYHPRGVILSALEKQCGSFSYK